MNNKHYTSIEQSKKLLSLGIDPESADMFWPNAPITVPCIDDDGCKGDVYLPCWSVGALLELMPPYLFDFSRGIDLNMYRNLNGKGWHVSYMPNNIEDMQKDKFRQITNSVTPLEAAYNMVCWLLENNYLNKK